MKKPAASAFLLAFALNFLPGLARAQGNLVVNGGFESIPPTGWKGNYGSIYTYDPVSTAKEGRGVGGFFMFEPISQQLPTEPFVPYLLEFSLISQSDEHPVKVTWGSQTVGNFLNDHTTEWRTFRANVTAESSSTELSFMATGGTWMIDAVSVTAIPEPSVAALGIAGLFLVGWKLRHRRP